MFFDFQFRSLCSTAKIPYAAGGLEQQVVELLPQNYSVAKTLENSKHACRALFQGAKISRKPATFEGTSRVRRSRLRNGSRWESCHHTEPDFAMASAQS